MVHGTHRTHGTHGTRKRGVNQSLQNWFWFNWSWCRKASGKSIWGFPLNFPYILNIIKYSPNLQASWSPRNSETIGGCESKPTSLLRLISRIQTCFVFLSQKQEHHLHTSGIWTSRSDQMSISIQNLVLAEGHWNNRSPLVGPCEDRHNKNSRWSKPPLRNSSLCSFWHNVTWWYLVFPESDISNNCGDFGQNNS